jgi:hypothetical protein
MSGGASTAAVHDQAARPPRSSFSPRATIVSASSGNGLCSLNASSGGAAIQVSNSSGFVRMTGMALVVAMLQARGLFEPTTKQVRELYGGVQSSLRNWNGKSVVRVGHGVPMRWLVRP